MLRSCLSLERGNEEQRQKRQINKGLFLIQEKFPWVRVTFSGRRDTPRAAVSFLRNKRKGERGEGTRRGGGVGNGEERRRERHPRETSQHGVRFLRLFPVKRG